MRKVSPTLAGFSFRAGLMIFATISALLIAQRILIYTHNVESTLKNIQMILDAHEEEMDEVVELHGIGTLEETFRHMSDNMRDKHLYMLLRHRNVLTGNLKSWPDVKMGGRYYAEITFPVRDEITPLHLLVSISEYTNGDALLLGYDMSELDSLQNAFFGAIMNNIFLSFAVSLVISAFIIWLLSRHFRRFNIACDAVMEGNLDYRIRQQGAHDEFDRLAGNINRMLEWIRSLIHTFRDSSNALAHDMRTPLSRLRLELRALAERPQLESDVRGSIYDQVERLDEIIEMFENILSIAKAESRADAELFVSVDLAQLVRDVLEFYQPIIEEKHLKLVQELPQSPLEIKGDKQLLGQAVVNLVDNACKYTPASGQLAVSLKVAVKEVVLVVADNGEGIPEMYREKAKERFFRVDESRHTAGHGLGLSLVNAVGVLHQGSLNLEDNAPGLRAVLTLKR